MILTVEEFERMLKVLDPEQDDFVLHADNLIAALSPDVKASVYEPVLRFFEAHPKADCGAPGPLVHHVEDYYPNYVGALINSVRHAPSFNGVLMINRILNWKITQEQQMQYSEILRSVVGDGSAPENVRSMAKRFLDRQK